MKYNNMIDRVFDYMIMNFNFGYVLAINIIAYVIIQIISKISKNSIKKLYKILITVITTVVLFVVYKLFTNVELDILISSSILAPVAWDWIIKPILNKLGADYKNEQNY